MDAYLRVFQQQEIVQLYNGLGAYQTQDYIYLMEGFNSPTITKLVDSRSDIASFDIDLTVYTRGFQHWVTLNVASYVFPLTVTLKLDGVQVYKGSITNVKTIVPFVFTTQKTLSVVITGSGTLTTSLWQIATATNNTEILWIDNQKFLYRLNHPVKGPTATYPIASNFDQQINVVPSAFDYIAVSFLKRPTKPIYAFTTSGDRYIYDDASSQDAEWPEEILDLIMEKTLANLGINMRDERMIAYSNQQSRTVETDRMNIG
jgi:hypothetical protein